MSSARGLEFSRELRLSNAKEFDFVFDNAKRSTNRCFTVLARENSRAYPRLGLIVSKRCAKSAVLRNRLKRIIRESFRQNRAQLVGLDLVVIGKASALAKTNNELFTLLSRQWNELQRCKES